MLHYKVMTNELEKKQFCSAHKLSLQETKTSKTICFKTTSNIWIPKEFC